MYLIAFSAPLSSSFGASFGPSFSASLGSERGDEEAVRWGQDTTDLHAAGLEVEVETLV